MVAGHVFTEAYRDGEGRRGRGACASIRHLHTLLYCSTDDTHKMNTHGDGRAVSYAQANKYTNKALTQTSTNAPSYHCYYCYLLLCTHKRELELLQ